MYLLICLVFFKFSIYVVNGQTILFPHGYFDTKKMTAYEAFYLHMFALSTLENGGITEEELDELTKQRKLPEKAKVITSDADEKNNGTNRHDETETADVPPTPAKQGVKSPFSSHRVRRKESTEEKDDDFNPFDDIATRAPPRARDKSQRILDRSQILGISPHRPRHGTKATASPTSHQNEKQEATEDKNSPAWTNSRPRRPFIEIDITQPHIIDLPVPPNLK